MTDHLAPVDAERGGVVFAPLARSVRALIDATIRTEVDDDTVERARALVEQATELLAAVQMPGSFGVRPTVDGTTAAWGNAAIGLRNPIAPPLVIRYEADGVVRTDVALGAAYEGPPNQVHGGVCALILDHVLGATAHRPDRPAFTGTLTIRYLRPTYLGQLHAEARIEREDASKTFAVGHISDADGITVEAHGVFIRPKTGGVTSA